MKTYIITLHHDNLESNYIFTLKVPNEVIFHQSIDNQEWCFKHFDMQSFLDARLKQTVSEFNINCWVTIEVEEEEGNSTLTLEELESENVDYLLNK